MAQDLIPPPSPAGRPQPDSSEPREERSTGSLWYGRDEGATGVAPATVEAPREDFPPAPGREPAAVAATPAPYRSRFGFVLGALIGVALAAIAIALLVSVRAADDGVPEGWSTWRPSTGDDIGAAKQIAEHVGPQYRLGDGEQLVAVQAGPLEIADVPLSVALRTSANGGDIELIDGHGVMYTLNGLGPRGSIAEGEPSEERHLLLRREALELALYTFRYADDVDMVVALLPPKPPGNASDPTAQSPVQALFFRPGDLKGQLDVPLRATIPAKTPRPETFGLSGQEGRRIDALTRSNLFEASFQQGQDAHAFLVLRRLG